MARVIDLKQVMFANHPAAANVIGANKVTDILNAILPNIYVIASLILFVYLVVGGFMIIASASNPEQAKKGQQAVSNAVVGFTIIFTSFWIIQAIQIITGIPILNSNLTF